MQFMLNNWIFRDIEVGAQLFDFKSFRINMQYEQALVGRHSKYIFFSRALEVINMGLFFEGIMHIQNESGIL